MTRAKTSSDANFSPPEFVRLTFPDQGAFEREIATNLRYGQVFVRELLKFPVLTDGVIVLVHPVSLRELRLPAQIVMVNSDGAQRGTGLALRAFGRAELEQLEAFARDPGPAPAPRRATSGDVSRTKSGTSSNSDDGSQLVSQPVRTRGQSSATNTPAGARSGSDVERSRITPQPLAADPRTRTASSGVQRLALQPIDRTAAATGGRPRAPSSAANPVVRRAAREVDATPARARSSAKHSPQRPAQEIDARSLERAGRGLQPPAARGGANTPVPRPAQEINRSDLDSERMGRDQRPRTASRVTQTAVQPPPMAASAVRPGRVEADDWSDFEHGPEPGAVTPTATTPTVDSEPPAEVVARTPAPCALATTLTPSSVEEDDWSDFEHGPEPTAPAAHAPAPSPATNQPLGAEGAEAAEPTVEADVLSIPYDLESARARAPSAAFVSSPHTAVTHRPPPKDDPEPSHDTPSERD
jgi:hypothetical protein